MIKKIFVRGLITLAPLAITLAIVIWLFNFIEKVFSQIFIDIAGPKYYIPGMGVLIAIILIFLVGMLMGNWMSKKIYGAFEKLLQKMPLVKTLYRSILDLMSFFKNDQTQTNGKVVMVNFHGAKILGLVSREAFADLPNGIGKTGEVAVFLPMSYQIGGVTVIVPKSMIEPVQMTIEQGLRFAATAGMPGEQTEKNKEVVIEKK